jgi:putative endonuclease
MKGYMYILRCADGTFYTGSTKNLDFRLAQHKAGEGANYTKKRLPVELLYFEEFQNIADAFYREKQIQSWSRAKKIALIEGKTDDLKTAAKCKNDTKYDSKTDNI